MRRSTVRARAADGAPRNVPGVVGGNGGSRFAKSPEGQRVIGTRSLHEIEQLTDQCSVALLAAWRAQSCAADRSIQQASKCSRNAVDHRGCDIHRSLHIGIDQRQERFGESRHVPLCHGRLVPIRVAAVAVDGAEHGGRIVGVHEGAGTEVDGLSGNRRVVRIHDAVNESDCHPRGDERGLAAGHRGQQLDVGLVGGLDLRVVAIDHVIGKAADRLRVTARGEVFEGAYPHVTRGHARHDGARQACAAEHGLARRDGRQRAGGRRCRASASTRSPDIRAAPDRARRGRRRCARRACGPCPSAGCRAARRRGRSPRRGEGAAVAELRQRTVRTGVPHRPSRWDPRPTGNDVARENRGERSPRRAIATRARAPSPTPVEFDEPRIGYGDGIEAREESRRKRSVAIGERPSRYREARPRRRRGLVWPGLQHRRMLPAN